MTNSRRQLIHVRIWIFRRNIPRWIRDRIKTRQLSDRIITVGIIKHLFEQNRCILNFCEMLSVSIHSEYIDRDNFSNRMRWKYYHTRDENQVDIETQRWRLFHEKDNVSNWNVNPYTLITSNVEQEIHLKNLMETTFSDIFSKNSTIRVLILVYRSQLQNISRNL